MKSKRGLNNIFVSSQSEAKKFRPRSFPYIGHGDEYVLQYRSNFVIVLLKEKSSLDQVQVLSEINKHTHTYTNKHIYISIVTSIYLYIKIFNAYKP